MTSRLPSEHPGARKLASSPAPPYAVSNAARAPPQGYAAPDKLPTVFPGVLRASLSKTLSRWSHVLLSEFLDIASAPTRVPSLEQNWQTLAALPAVASKLH